MSVNFSDKRSPCDIAKIRAQQLRRVRQEVNPFRARSQYGEPVIFQKLKERSNISRRSRVMSDPEIPSALVILNAKGLFEGKKGAERKTETRYAPVGKMNEEGCKPMFCDPSNSNNGRVSDLKKRFESLERDNVVSSAGSEFFNPLHKGNQPAVSSKRTSREVRIDVQTKLGKALNENDTDLETKRNSKVADSENLLQNKYLDTTKISKTLPSKLDNVVEIPNTSTKQSNSALKMEDGKLKETSNESVKESELVTSPPPNRPPPRHPLHSPKKEPLKYCRDKSGDENAVSRISQAKEDVEENVLQQESILEGQQNTGSKTFSNSTLDGNDTSSGFDIDDDDSDDWGSDFDEDGDEKEENENISKHDSHSSHGSSCEADPIIEFPDAVSKKLYNIVSEILSTERAYVRRLYLLDQVFYHRLNNECCAQGSVPGEALNDIFSNIQAIHQLHRDFLLPKLEARIKDWANNNQIGDILKGLAPFLKMYTLYVGNFDKATETLSTWMKKSPAMTAVIEEIQKSKECENLTLQHHMLEPVQRVPRYQLLLKDYLSKLPEDSEDLKNTSDALGIISESARHANDSMKKTERFKILLDIQDRIGDDFPLITASREFVMEGEFKKVAARTSESHQERTLMLFNDVLLCCAKFPGSNKYKVKVEMDLYGMEIRTEDEDLEIENAFRIISKQRVMDFTAPNAEARETFVNKLKEAVDECTNKRDSYKKSSNVVLKEGELGKKAPAWVRDEAVSMCMLCDVLFTKLRRRHHCRACGRVVCGSCSGYKAAMEFKNGKMEKVCEMCHRILVKGSSEEKAKEAVVKGKSILKINSDSKIWYSGYLNFKMRGDKSWQKRWFVLSSDFVLFRYKAKKDIKAELTLPLPGHNVDKPSLADEVERKNVFKVHHKNMRVHFFQAQNEDSVNRWMEILTKATKAEQVDTEEEEEEGKTQRAGTQ